MQCFKQLYNQTITSEYVQQLARGRVSRAALFGICTAWDYLLHMAISIIPGKVYFIEYGHIQYIYGHIIAIPFYRYCNTCIDNIAIACYYAIWPYCNIVNVVAIAILQYRYCNTWWTCIAIHRTRVLLTQVQ